MILLLHVQMFPQPRRLARSEPITRGTHKLGRPGAGDVRLSVRPIHVILRLQYGAVSDVLGARCVGRCLEIRSGLK